MKSLPFNSTFSFFKGVFFVFRDGENTITLHGSTLTCNEKVYLNGKLIVQKRVFKKNSTIEFLCDGINYRVEIAVTKIFNGSIVCSLFKNNILSYQQTAFLEKNTYQIRKTM